MRDVSLERLSTEDKLGVLDIQAIIDDEVKRMAFLHEKWERDYESGMEQAREEGHESGLKEGRAEGRASGLQEGRKEGKQSEKIEIARKMKQKGMDIQIIMELTGLREEEIKNIK